MLKLRVGARGSALSVAQTKKTIQQLENALPEISLELVPYATAGDTDKKTSLTDNSIPEDFFSDTLDKAVLNGELDAAIHSAKDLPDYIGSGIAWFTIPWREDTRDCIILRKDAQIPANPKIGVSSDNREQYALEKWPDGELVSIRGDIENRISQLDDHKVDILILAVAGLNRLGLEDRITEKVPVCDLPTHPLQGKIAVTFKEDHQDMLMIRLILNEMVHICGAGTGKDGNYTHSVTSALSNADLVLRDALMHDEILEHCKGEVVSVGKRYSDNAAKVQDRIHNKLLSAICHGDQVVRLKGGDPALFGRLTEELEFLQQHKLSWKLHPGIPWFCSATLKHGIMITSRNEIRQFTVSTGTQVDGQTVNCEDLQTPFNGSIYFYMATRKIETICKSLIEQGVPENTAAAIFTEDRGSENIIRGTLIDIQEKFKNSSIIPPAIFQVGDATMDKHSYLQTYGPLSGKRIMVCGTELTNSRLEDQIIKCGGEPVIHPLFKLEKTSYEWIHQLKQTDWVILSSASAATFFIQAIRKMDFDIRLCPKVACSGPSASQVLKEHGIHCDYQASVYTSETLANELIDNNLIQDSKVLVLTSSVSQSKLTEIIKPHVNQISKYHLYENTPLDMGSSCPDFEYILFCSPSAFKAFQNNYPGMLKGKMICSIGSVTTKAIQSQGYEIYVEPKTFDAKHLVYALASKALWST